MSAMESGGTRERIWIGQNVVAEAQSFVLDQAESILQLINAVRERYAVIFGQDVKPATIEQLTEAVARLFGDPPLAINLACLIKIATSLEADVDYDNLVVDEILGARIAEMIAATEPGRTYSQASFHLMDVIVRKEIGLATPEHLIALDDALAGLAAGFEAILPGWAWMEHR